MKVEQMEKLREALEGFDTVRELAADGVVLYSHSPIVEVARSVLNAPEAWWCEKHDQIAHITDDSQTEPESCEDIEWKRCSLVRVRLVEVTE